MHALALFVSQLGIGGGLLLGVPLVLIGLALRGLSRRHLGVLRDATLRRRRVAELEIAGRVALTGRARLVDDGRVALEDLQGATGRVLVEPPGTLRLRDGEVVVVYGDAVLQVGAAVGYREAARTWIVDASGDEHFVLTDGMTLARATRRMRVQALSGALAFATGIVLIVGGSLAAVSTLLTG